MRRAAILAVGLALAWPAWADDAPPPAQAASPAPAAPPPAAPAPRLPNIDDRTAPLEGQPSASDALLDNRIRASVAAAEGFQGPLDGRWVLYDAKGQGLFIFQLVDPPRGGALEGAWRDLRRPPGVAAWGVVDQLQRTGGALTFVFPERDGAPPVSITLEGDPATGWSGKMNDGAGAEPVTLKRN